MYSINTSLQIWFKDRYNIDLNKMERHRLAEHPAFREMYEHARDILLKEAYNDEFVAKMRFWDEALDNEFERMRNA